MLISIGILLIATAILFLELPKLLKQNETKDTWTFSILLFCGTGLSIAMAFHVKLSNPFDWITFILQPFSNLFLSLLK